MSKNWGTPTWNFFHTLAEKIDEDYYKSNYIKIYDIIKKICSNLPCPECTKHAQLYLKRIRPESLKNKEDFKNMLFNFHNEVNKRKRKPIFTKFALYKDYDFDKCYIDFKIQYLSNRTLNRGFIFTMHRRNMMKHIDTYISSIRDKIR